MIRVLVVVVMQAHGRSLGPATPPTDNTTTTTIGAEFH